MNHEHSDIMIFECEDVGGGDRGPLEEVEKLPVEEDESLSLPCHLLTLSSDCLNRVSFYLKSGDRMVFFVTGDKRMAALWAASLTDLSTTARSLVKHILGSITPVHLHRYFTSLLDLSVEPKYGNYLDWRRHETRQRIPFLTASDISKLPMKLTRFSALLGMQVLTAEFPKSLTCLDLMGVNGDFDLRCLPQSITKLKLQVGRERLTTEPLVPFWPPNLISLDLNLHGSWFEFGCNYHFDHPEDAFPPNLTKLTFRHPRYYGSALNVITAISRLTHLTSLDTDTDLSENPSENKSLHLLPPGITELSYNFLHLPPEWSSLPRGIVRTTNPNHALGISFNYRSYLFTKIWWDNSTIVANDKWIQSIPPLLEMVHLIGVTTEVPFKSATTHLVLSKPLKPLSCISSAQVRAASNMTGVEHLLLTSHLDTKLELFDQCAWKLKSLHIANTESVFGGVDTFLSSTFEGRWAKSLTRLIVGEQFRIHENQFESLPDSIEWLHISNRRTHCLPHTKLPSSLTRLVLPSMWITVETKLPPNLTHLCVFENSDIRIEPSVLFPLLPKDMKYVYFACSSSIAMFERPSYYDRFEMHPPYDRPEQTVFCSNTREALLEQCRTRGMMMDFMVDNKSESDQSYTTANTTFYYRYGILNSSPSNLKDSVVGGLKWNGACIDGMSPQ